MIGGGIAILALIGGVILVAIDKDAVGSAVLILDAVFVFSQKLVKPSQPASATQLTVSRRPALPANCRASRGFC